MCQSGGTAVGLMMAPAAQRGACLTLACCDLSNPFVTSCDAPSSPLFVIKAARQAGDMDIVVREKLARAHALCISV